MGRLRLGLLAIVVVVLGGMPLLPRAVVGAAEFYREITALGDDDDDGLPNAWESEYFGGPTNAVREADNDGDGMNNWSEYIAGSDPTNGASAFVLGIDFLYGTNRTDTFTSSDSNFIAVARSEGERRIASYEARANGRKMVVVINYDNAGYVSEFEFYVDDSAFARIFPDGGSSSNGPPRFYELYTGVTQLVEDVDGRLVACGALVSEGAVSLNATHGPEGFLNYCDIQLDDLAFSVEVLYAHDNRMIYCAMTTDSLIFERDAAFDNEGILVWEEVRASGAGGVSTNTLSERFNRNAGFAFSWPSHAGRVYTLEESGSVSASAWDVIEEDIVATPPENIFAYEIQNVLTNGLRLYRVQVRME